MARILRLVLREIVHRKVGFLFTLAPVAIATACLVGMVVLLSVSRSVTALILEEKRSDVVEAGEALEDAMRRITKGLGFNVLILPADQDLGQLHLDGSLTSTMPEDYVDRLAASRIVTVNHLLPSVVKRIEWPEQGFSVILQGTRGEVPLLHADPKKPLIDSVPPGSIVLGHEVNQRLGASVGDQLLLKGKEFVVSRVHTQRGSADDMTVWVHLSSAQSLLGMDNLIHAILALECHCVGDRITAVRQEIQGILPGTQVIERGRPALARAEARAKAKEAAELALEHESAARAELHAQQDRMATIVIPASFAVATVWIGLLALGNVRERRNEIGVLHAMGFRVVEVVGVFAGRAVLVGLIGGLIGTLAGFPCGRFAAMRGAETTVIPALTTEWFWALGVGFALVITLVGNWLPVLWAARQDPAELLQDR